MQSDDDRYRLGTRLEVESFYYDLIPADDRNESPVLEPPRLAKCTEFWICEREGTILGFAGIADEGYGHPQFHVLVSVYVLEGARGHGRAVHLVEHAVRSFIRQCKTPVYCQPITAEMRAVLAKVAPDVDEHLEMR